MKHANRVLSCIMVAILMLSLATGCKSNKAPKNGSEGSTTSSSDDAQIDSENESQSDGTEPSSDQSTDNTNGEGTSGKAVTTRKKAEVTFAAPTAKPTIDRGKYDLKGATIKVIGWDKDIQPVLGETDIGDAGYYAMKYAEKKYNCKFQFNYKFSGDSYNTQILTSSLSHKACADVMGVHCLSYADWIKRGMLYDVSNVVQKAPDAKHWKQEISEYKGKTYGMDAVGVRPLHSFFLLYNTSLLKTLNLTSPQTLYNNGQWTFTKFLDYCKAAAARKDTYGIGSFGADDFCFASAGANGIYVKDSNGKYKNAYTYSGTKAKAEKALGMLLQMKKYMLGDVCQDMAPKLACVDSFTQNKCLFIRSDLNQAQSLKDQGEKNFAPVPFPLNGASSWENSENYFAFTAISAYSTLNKDAVAAAIMDMKTIWDTGRGKAYYHENEASWADDLASKYFAKRADGEFMINAGKGTTYKGYSFLNLGGTVTWDIVTPVIRGEKTPAQVLSSTDSTIQAKIDSVLNS